MRFRFQHLISISELQDEIEIAICWATRQNEPGRVILLSEIREILNTYYITEDLEQVFEKTHPFPLHYHKYDANKWYFCNSAPCRNQIAKNHWARNRGLA